MFTFCTCSFLGSRGIIHVLCAMVKRTDHSARKYHADHCDEKSLSRVQSPIEINPHLGGHGFPSGISKLGLWLCRCHSWRPANDRRHGPAGAMGHHGSASQWSTGPVFWCIVHNCMPRVSPIRSDLKSWRGWPLWAGTAKTRSSSEAGRIGDQFLLKQIEWPGSKAHRHLFLYLKSASSRSPEKNTPKAYWQLCSSLDFRLFRRFVYESQKTTGNQISKVLNSDLTSVHIPGCVILQHSRI